MATKKAAFGAGCFWGVESFFREVHGVSNAVCGYMGGKTKEPTYEDVCTHMTGHAEVVEVAFDPAEVSFDKLLEVFWENHDPTTVNRQGPDVGDQYRSAVFCYDDEQKKAAEAMKAKLDASGRFKRPIVTEIAEAPEFWRAEDYHQRYFERRGVKPACHKPVS
ncbi:MAG: peptide-methionine (S)-S-oxide reductase MsrA [Elusimicrobia bacterium]|nr:peptide-methionine (S)-S-oxide reductase MsrA [Elusimicrobiota bacterium]